MLVSRNGEPRDSTKTQNTIYAINEEPYCFWGHDRKAEALDFLELIDPGYFQFLAHQARQYLENDPSRAGHAAVALRLGVFHGSEALFLLIGALVQGVGCPQAWIGQCSNTDLRAVIKRIHEGGPLLLQNSNIRELSWDGIAREVFRAADAEESIRAEVAGRFADFWARLASMHADPTSIDEYNSLKHGFRVGHGGFEIHVGPPGHEGIPEDKDMTSLGGSKWGTYFKVIKPVGAKGNANRSRRASDFYVNWSIEAQIGLLDLIAASISNVRSCLRIVHGAATEAFEVPPPEAFEVPWVPVGVTAFKVSNVPPGAQETSKQELLQAISLPPKLAE